VLGTQYLKTTGAGSSGRALSCFVLVVLLLLPSDVCPQAGKKFKTLTNQQALKMLDQVETDLRTHYYDPAMHGVDLGTRFDNARQEISTAKSQDEALLDIAGAVVALHDSHTRFLPPIRPYGVEYGWRLQAVGETDCYVSAVKKDSDAATKGLQAGDQILAINGIKLTREDLHYVEYSYAVFPQSGLHLQVRSTDGSERSIVAMAKIMPGQPVVRGIDFREYFRNYHPKDRSRYFSFENHVLLWKLPDFVISPGEAEDLIGKTRHYDSVILDLRGNPGGLEETLQKFVAGFFPHDIKIADKHGRGSSKPVLAKSLGNKAFSGKLIVLIDSKSASASEIFARIVQLEKRGVVLGDRSAGAVTEAEEFMHAEPLDASNVTQYGVSITVADLLMQDGKSLENVGVTPDERILPSPFDLRTGRDPVLARAIELAGGKLSPEEAGKIFPVEWPKQLVPEFD
jgi:C-terminal processing protease CtpA/Prc